jgi:hypothetical protein
MADINEFKEKVMGTLGVVADKTKDIAEKAADKAKQAARIAKLSVEIGNEKENMKKAYIEIGKLYYETHKDDTEGFFVQLCDEITLSQNSIAAKEAEIAELKSDIRDFSDGDIEVEFQEVVSQEEDSACGCADETADAAPAQDGTCDCCGEDKDDE